MPRVNLDMEFPVARSVIEKDLVTPASEPIVSRLSNGILVATKDSFKPVCTIGLSVMAGSKYESADFYGQSNFLEKFAFKTNQDTTSLAITRQIERMGGQINCQSSRESLFYSVDVIRQFAPSILKMMSNSLLSPFFNTHEIDNAKLEYAQSLENVTSEEKVEDDIHLAAFGMKGIGLPHKASLEMLDKITQHSLETLHAKLFHPERMALSAVGVDHYEFMAAAKEFFGGFKGKPGFETSQSTKAEYVGGEVRRFDEDEHKETFFAVAFKTKGLLSDDIPTLCVLGSLMGGGNSFSVGGPGKGMHSRLYARVLNGIACANSCSVLGHIHEDVGIFGISGSTDFAHAASFSEVIVEEAQRMASPKLLTDEAFGRAKNAAISTFLMNLENNRSVVEDFGRQLLLYEKVFSVEELLAKLQAVQKEDLLHLASKMLRSKPSIAMRGNTMSIPSYEKIAKKFE